MTQTKIQENNRIQDVYIMGGLRTPIGVIGGQYKSVQPELLGAKVLDALLDTYELEYVDSVFCGNAVGTGGNVARLMTLSSNLPISVPAVTVDMQCASGAMTIEMAYAHIRSGLMNTVIAGGIESSSLQPTRTYAEGDARTGEYLVAQFSPNENDPLVMLRGAERTIDKYGVSQDTLNKHVLRSHALAVQAMTNPHLKEKILPLRFDDIDCTDESIRPRMSEKLLHRMKPLLGPGTVTTAGNACLTHDGAAFVVVSSKPSACKIIGSTAWAGEPQYSPEGAWQSTEALLSKYNLTMDDIDVVEWNEAFAVIDVLFERAYPEALDRYNRLGGALAYGHPYGCSGAMLVLHAMAALGTVQGRYAICAIAGAGGTGTALLLEYNHEYHR